MGNLSQEAQAVYNAWQDALNRYDEIAEVLRVAAALAGSNDRLYRLADEFRQLAGEEADKWDD